MSNHLKEISLALVAAAIIACDNQVTPPSAATATTGLKPVAAQTQGSVLGSIRAATAKYHRVEVAVDDGYIRVSTCILNEGIHYLKPSLVNGVLDPTQPEHLLYEELPNGKLRLAGVEYVVPSAAWDPNNASAPMLGDQPLMDRRSFPYGAPFPNYALFVWVWTSNPDGLYTQLNPKVSCN